MRPQYHNPPYFGNIQVQCQESLLSQDRYSLKNNKLGIVGHSPIEAPPMISEDLVLPINRNKM